VAQAGGPALEGRYFEDLPIGTELRTSARTLGEGAVDLFAGLTGDFSYVHTDAEAASATIYGERIVHGLLSLCVLQGLMWQTRYTVDTGVATLGWERIRFPEPVRIGDTVRGVFTIREARESASRPDVGIVVEDCRLINQRGDTVVSGDHVLMVRRRPPAAPA
jgi:acyl dehydratase